LRGCPIRDEVKEVAQALKADPQRCYLVLSANEQVCAPSTSTIAAHYVPTHGLLPAISMPHRAGARAEWPDVAKCRAMFVDGEQDLACASMPIGSSVACNTAATARADRCRARLAFFYAAPGALGIELASRPHRAHPHDHISARSGNPASPARSAAPGNAVAARCRASSIREPEAVYSYAIRLLGPFSLVGDGAPLSDFRSKDARANALLLCSSYRADLAIALRPTLVQLKHGDFVAPPRRLPTSPRSSISKARSNEGCGAHAESQCAKTARLER